MKEGEKFSSIKEGFVGPNNQPCENVLNDIARPRETRNWTSYKSPPGTIT